MSKSLGAVLFVFVFAAFGFSNCAANAFAKTVKGNGVIETRNFDVRGFDRIHFALPTAMSVLQDSKYAFEFTADANVFDYIDVRVEDGVLTVNVTKGARIKSMKGKSVVFLPEIKEIEAAGSGDILLRGKAENLKCSVSGSGGIQAFDLPAVNVDCTIAGSSSIEVNAQKILAAKIAGAGSVLYRNTPEVRMNISGSGRCRRVE
ncbi:MAG: GIN domain-containing protein [Treponema sp.]